MAKIAYVGEVACTTLLRKNKGISMNAALRNRLSSLKSSFSFYRYSTFLSDLGLYPSNLYYLIHCNNKWAVGKSLTDCLLQVYTQDQIDACISKYAVERSKRSTSTIPASFKHNMLRSIKNFGRAQSKNPSTIFGVFDCELFPVYIDSDKVIAAFSLEKLHSAGFDNVFISTGSNSKDNQISQIIFEQNKSTKNSDYVEAKAKKLIEETVPLNLESSAQQSVSTQIEYFDYLKDIIEKEIERRANIRAQEIVQNMLKTLLN